MIPLKQLLLIIKSCSAKLKIKIATKWTNNNAKTIPSYSRKVKEETKSKREESE